MHQHLQRHRDAAVGSFGSGLRVLLASDHADRGADGLGGGALPFASRKPPDGHAKRIREGSKRLQLGVVPVASFDLADDSRGNVSPPREAALAQRRDLSRPVEARLQGLHRALVYP